MGKYDNYNNAENIAIAQKALDKLVKKKKPNLFKIDMAKNNLENAKLFESCQIFGKITGIMFSDDNNVMSFFGSTIYYKNIASYSFTENIIKKAKTTTKKKGTVTRAVVGGALFGGVGALVGASSAGSKSDTTFYEKTKGFILTIRKKDGTGVYCQVPSGSFFSNKIPETWLDIGMKLKTIIETTID